MPGMDGVKLGQTIKSDSALKEVHMIMLTSRGMRGDAAKMRKVGFSAYLTKPIRRSQLYDTFITVLGKKINDSKRKTSQLVTRHTIAEDRKKKLRVLLVEDNIVNQKLAIRLLQKFGLHADPANQKGDYTLSSFKIIFNFWDTCFISNGF